MIQRLVGLTSSELQIMRAQVLFAAPPHLLLFLFKQMAVVARLAAALDHSAFS